MNRPTAPRPTSTGRRLARQLLVTTVIVLLFAIQSASATPAERRGLGRVPPGGDALGGKSRIALVVGNSDYKYVSTLGNPVNDATDLGKALREAGFEVTTLTNASRTAMLDAISQFGEKLAESDGGVGLFYYAGHGIQVDGENYLVPVEAKLRKPHQARSQAVQASQILAEMNYARSGFNIVILDACRNNPFKLSGHGVKRSIRGGLAEIRHAPNNTIIGFATEPNNVASDGEGRNGTYTKHLLEQIRTRGLSMTKIFQNVRKGVRLDTKGAQLPWVNASTEESFYFYPPRPLASISPEDAATESQVWNTAWKMYQATGNERFLMAYVEKYPNGIFLAFAREIMKPAPSGDDSNAGGKTAGSDADPADHPTADISAQDKAEIDRLMKKGWDAFAKSHWTTPEHDNAVKWAEQALELDEDNAEALSLIRAVFDKYLALSNFSKAESLLGYATPKQRRQYGEMRSNRTMALSSRQAALSQWPTTQWGQQPTITPRPGTTSGARTMDGVQQVERLQNYIKGLKGLR